MPEGRARAQTMAATDRDEGRKPLGKNPLRTGGVPAEETTDLQRQDQRGPGQRQVGHRASVKTMHRSRTVLTARTHGRAPPAAEVNMPHAIHPAMGPQAKAGEVRQKSLQRYNTTSRSLQRFIRTSFPNMPLSVFHNPPSSAFIENGTDPGCWDEDCNGCPRVL